MSGYILWRGKSRLDGAPIVVIALTGSSNSKTGNMVQTYILRSDMSPVDAVHTGSDVSICGDCVHRGASGNGKGRTCYVNVGQGPTIVYKKFKRGGYKAADSISVIGHKRVVRLGTYGDPAAVPVWVWESLISECVAHTGYTHQWKHFDKFKTLCMASADTEQAAKAAQLDGWRTFRVALPSQTAKLKGEAVCPASAEGGRKLNCIQCKACEGTKNGRRGSIVIQAHGGIAVMANVARLSLSIVA